MIIKSSFKEKEKKNYIIGIYKEEVLEEVNSYKYLYLEIYNEKGEIVEDVYSNRVFLDAVVPNFEEGERIKKRIFDYYKELKDVGV